MISRMKYTITAFLITLSFFALVPVTASAQIPRLDVQFETMPLFSNDDFKPLDRMCRYVRVTNLTNATQPVVMEAINESGCTNADPNCLASRLELEVLRGATSLYKKFLAVFYADGEVVIDTISPEETKQYDLCVTFTTGPDDDNLYQTLQTGFDLLVGYQGAQTNTSTGSGPRGLQIRGEASSVSTTLGAINITWTTDYPATSQVIYGLSSGGPYTLDLSQQNYGYPFATVEDGTKVLNHNVLLTGLTPGATYRYRVVSHASPATVSYEHEFTVPNDPIYASLPMNIGGTVPEYVEGAQLANEKRVEAISVESGHVAQALAPQEPQAKLAVRSSQEDAPQIYDGGFVPRVRSDFTKDPETNASMTYGVMALVSVLLVGLGFIRRRLS